MYFNELTALKGQELSRAGVGSEKLILARQGGPNEWVVMGGRGARARGRWRREVKECKLLNASSGGHKTNPLEFISVLELH